MLRPGRSLPARHHGEGELRGPDRHAGRRHTHTIADTDPPKMTFFGTARPERKLSLSRKIFQEYTSPEHEKNLAKINEANLNRNEITRCNCMRARCELTHEHAILTITINRKKIEADKGRVDKIKKKGAMIRQ